MARRRSTKRNRAPRQGAPRRRRVVGLGTGAGAVLAFGLAAAPSANADVEDLIIDPVLQPLINLIDPLVGVASSADSALALPSDALAAAASSADSIPAAADPSAIGAVIQDIWLPIHTFEQDWITSPTGTTFDTEINTATGEFLIGNGANGTLLDPNGGAGGLLFGDGGRATTRSCPVRPAVTAGLPG